MLSIFYISTIYVDIHVNTSLLFADLGPVPSYQESELLHQKQQSTPRDCTPGHSEVLHQRAARSKLQQGPPSVTVRTSNHLGTIGSDTSYENVPRGWRPTSTGCDSSDGNS